MNKTVKKALTTSIAVMCSLGITTGVGAYELNDEVRTVTPALLQATQIGVKTFENPQLKHLPNKDAILVMTFGTTFKETRMKTIEAVEAAIHRAHPDIPVFEAYTAHIIVDRVLENEGVKKMTPEEAFTTLKKEGYTRVAVVPLDIIPGIEYDYKSIAARMHSSDFKKITVATPLLYFQGTEDERDDVVEMIKAIEPQIPVMSSHDATLLMAHGTPHPANAYYSVIQERLHELGHDNVFVYSVEGRPNLEDVIPQLHAQNIKHVTLMPIMMVAGDHANNDMAGPEEDSHKSILEKEGLSVDTYIHGLGELKQIRQIYVERATEAVEALQK